MKILICGATGFVGRHLTKTLRKAGHIVVLAVRRPSETDDIAVDFLSDTTKEVWLPRLEGVDVVINAVGVLRDSRKTPMQKLHSEAPKALFTACAEIGIKRVIHLSALGVESGINVPYFTTRIAAETALFALPETTRYLCLRPSVIYGADGTSAQMFKRMAKLPVMALPMGGEQSLQPVHIDDISAAVVQWLVDENASSQTVNVVGAEQTTMRGMLDSYREQMGYRPALHIAVPSGLVRIAALIGDRIPASPMCSDTYTMLSAGNIADVRQFSQLLKRTPKNFREFIATSEFK